MPLSTWSGTQTPDLPYSCCPPGALQTTFILLPPFLLLHDRGSTWFQTLDLRLVVFSEANMLFGLGGTQELSLPMLTVLRRFSILMTMIGEFYILKVVADMKVQVRKDSVTASSVNSSEESLNLWKTEPTISPNHLS